MNHEQVPVIIPAEIELREHNHLACLRFHYHLENGEPLPVAGKLFTAITPEQAIDIVRYLQSYIQRAAIAQGSQQVNSKPN